MHAYLKKISFRYYNVQYIHFLIVILFYYYLCYKFSEIGIKFGVQTLYYMNKIFLIILQNHLFLQEYACYCFTSVYKYCRRSFCVESDRKYYSFIKSTVMPLFGNGNIYFLRNISHNRPTFYIPELQGRNYVIT